MVIAINPTGSTGYGKVFEDAIQNNWGKRSEVKLNSLSKAILTITFSRWRAIYRPYEGV